MTSLEDDLESLSQLMEQEIAIYGLLVEALKREAECLREGERANDSLLEVVRTIEQHTANLRQVDGRAQAAVGNLLEILGEKEKEKTLSHLVTLLPPAHRRKLKSYQKTLLRLQDWIKENNEKNKTFIEEHLIFLQHLTSFLIHPVPDLPCYPGMGRSSSTVPSYALNREV